MRLAIFIHRTDETMSKNKKKKEKPIYIDDGSTIADMSGVGKSGKRESKSASAQDPQLLRPRSTLKEQRDTYFSAVKMMFLPMLVTIGIISVAFLILWLAFGSH